MRKSVLGRKRTQGWHNRNLEGACAATTACAGKAASLGARRGNSGSRPFGPFNKQAKCRRTSNSAVIAWRTFLAHATCQPHLGEQGTATVSNGDRCGLGYVVTGRGGCAERLRRRVSRRFGERSRKNRYGPNCPSSRTLVHETICPRRNVPRRNLIC